jgi:NifU-like protein involved in Fe-S cluster formation
MKYSALTRQFFEAAPSAGQIDWESAGRGEAGRVELGTWIQFDIVVRANRIETARFKAFACPHTIATAAWLASAASQFSAVAELPESVHALQQRFDVPVEKLGRLLLVEDAWCAAIRAAITKSAAGLA